MPWLPARPPLRWAAWKASSCRSVFWFFLIRPQQKRQKEHMQMCEGLTRGDEVTTLGGISGRIESVDEQTIGLQVASVDGKPVVIRMQRTSVSVVLPKGTLKI